MLLKPRTVKSWDWRTIFTWRIYRIRGCPTHLLGKDWWCLQRKRTLKNHDACSFLSPSENRKRQINLGPFHRMYIDGFNSQRQLQLCISWLEKDLCPWECKCWPIRISNVKKCWSQFWKSCNRNKTVDTEGVMAPSTQIPKHELPPLYSNVKTKRIQKQSVIS